MKKRFAVILLIVACLALDVAAICFQVSFFFLSAAGPAKFYVSIMEATGKSLAPALLPLIATGVICSVAGVILLWRLGKVDGLRQPLRVAGFVNSAVWLFLSFNFLGFVRVLPAGLFPGPPPDWVSVDQVNTAAMLRVYFRMFRPDAGMAPIAQIFPWLVAVATFLFLAFFMSRKTSKT